MGEYKNKYTWLRIMNMYTGKLYANRDAMDELVEFAPGWALAFGEIMLEELDEAIKAAGVVDSFVVLQIKEKFGELKLYHNQPRNSEIDIICKKYSTISQFICIRCGKPSVPLVFAPWIRPMCKDCYLKTEHLPVDNGEFEEFTKTSSDVIPDKMCWEEFERYDKENQKAVYKKFAVDISDTVDKIRAHWEERVANGTHIIEESKLDKTYTLEEVSAILSENLGNKYE